MVFELTLYIQVLTRSRVIEAYLIRLSLKTHVLDTFTTGHNIVPNGTTSGTFEQTFTGTLTHWS